MLPFKPYAIAVAYHIDTVLPNHLVRTLYWSNYAYGAYNIQRCLIDGTRIETILYNVSSNNMYDHYVN